MNNILKSIFHFLYKPLSKIGLSNTLSSYLVLVYNLILLLFLSYIIYRVLRFVFYTMISVVFKRKHEELYTLFISNNLHRYAAYFFPIMLINKSIPIIWDRYDYWEDFFIKIINTSLTILFVGILHSFLRMIKDSLKRTSRYSDKPVDSFIQIFIILIWTIGGFVVVSKLFGIGEKEILTTLGAVSALSLLIFRDVILGFVASINIAVNDMVRVGDWITMDKYGADGDVIEINLGTVKVKNFNNSTTTIPTYSLISDSFQNWRGIFESEGRRIKRSILIKSKSVRFLTKEELQELKKIDLIRDYILEKEQKELHQKELHRSINSELTTNLTLFRIYVTEYLKKCTDINKKSSIVCRQLQSTPTGIPLEIYAFSKEKKFEKYENILSDIFEHLFSVVVYFDIETFESTSQPSRTL